MLRLLHSLLMPLLQGLHLLLLLVTSMDGLSNGTADGASYVFTAVVVTQDVTGTDAMGDEALLIFTFGDMLPQSLHTGTVRRDQTFTVFVMTLSCMPQQKKTLLLMTQDLLTIGYLAICTTRNVPSILRQRRRLAWSRKRLLTLRRRLVLYRCRLHSLLLLRLPHNWIDLRYIHNSLGATLLLLYLWGRLLLHRLEMSVRRRSLLHRLLVALNRLLLLLLHWCYWLLLRWDPLLRLLLHGRLVLHRLWLTHVLGWRLLLLLLLLLCSLRHLSLLDSLRFHPNTMRQLLQALFQSRRIVVFLERLGRPIQRLL